MNYIIGRKVTFIRQIYHDRGVDKSLEYTGIVLDKIIGLEKVEGRNYRAEFYLVELPDGIVAKFFCDEAVRIEKRKPEASPKTADETITKERLQLQHQEDL